MPAWENSKLARDIHNAILDDDYMFIVIHGPPRCSKSTLALRLTNGVYEDWDKSLSATVFNLPSAIQRMEDGQPERWPTINGLHMRVPLINFDDFGVHSNKADTQHSTAWDIFKGGFDALGTMVGVLMVNMVDAGEATSQLQGKYTHEVTITSRGKYKYDKVQWLQDYSGFRTKMKKIWIENGDFEKLPDSVYKDYDELRMDLTKQVFVRIKDAFSMESLDYLLTILKDSDIALLRMIDTKGPIHYYTVKEKLGESWKDTVTKCKARSLVIPTRIAENQYKLDLSSLGRDILTSLDKSGKNTTEVKKFNE